MDGLQLIGTAEVSEILGISRQAVRQAVKSGRLTPVAVIGKGTSYVFNLSDVRKLAKNQKRGNHATA